jgi:hypothetical protein
MMLKKNKTRSHNEKWNEICYTEYEMKNIWKWYMNIVKTEMKN